MDGCIVPYLPGFLRARIPAESARSGRCLGVVYCVRGTDLHGIISP
jgi:hypothetical protein